jgi:hypothetical protein
MALAKAWVGMVAPVAPMARERAAVVVASAAMAARVMAYAVALTYEHPAQAVASVAMVALTTAYEHAARVVASVAMVATFASYARATGSKALS